MRFCLLATPLGQLWVSALEESRICRFLRAAVCPLLLLCVFSLLSSPGIAQARAGTAGVTAVKDANGNPVNPPFKKGVKYTVEWAATENVKDLHLLIDPDLSVSFDGTPANIEIRIPPAIPPASDWRGITKDNAEGTERWINILAPAGDPGAQAGSFTIEINGTEPTEYTPIFTNDGAEWDALDEQVVIPDGPNALPIPSITMAGVKHVLDSNGVPAGTPANPYERGEVYTVWWEATEIVKDIHLRIGKTTTVDFNNGHPEDYDIEISDLGDWEGSIGVGSTWINLVPKPGKPGAKLEKFKIQINAGPVTVFEFLPYFTRDGDKWSYLTGTPGVSDRVVPNAKGARRIPFLAYTAALEVDGLVAGAPATVHVANATPLGKVRLGYSLAGGGPTSTPYGNVLLSPPYTVLPSLHADGLGHAALTVPVPAGTAGVHVWFHALDIGTLTFTNGVAAVIL